MEAFTTETSEVFETTFVSFFISDFFSAGIFFAGAFSFAADFFTAVVFFAVFDSVFAAVFVTFCFGSGLDAFEIFADDFFTAEVFFSVFPPITLYFNV